MVRQRHLETGRQTRSLCELLRSNDGCGRVVQRQRHWIDDTHSNALSNLLSRLNETEVLRTEETQGSTDKRDALPTVWNNAAWMDLAQRKRVEIHDGLWSNKVDGLFELDD